MKYFFIFLFLLFSSILLFFLIIEFVREVIIIFFPKFKDNKLNKFWLDLIDKISNVEKQIEEIKIIEYIRDFIAYILILFFRLQISILILLLLPLSIFFTVIQLILDIFSKDKISFNETLLFINIKSSYKTLIGKYF